MPLDQANWQLNLLAADKTAAAFRSVNQSMRQLDSASKATSTVMTTGFASVTRMLGPLAAGFTAAALAQRVWQASMKAGDLGEQAEQIGLTTDQLQAYRLAAGQAGITAEQMDAAMMKLARAMGTANDGSDEMIAKFDKLGVKLLDSSGSLRKASDVMPEIARGLLKIGSETERTALMQELFGRSGARLTTVLEALAEGNEKVVAAAKKQNAVIGSETIKAWDELGDRLIVAGQRFDTMAATFGKPIAIAGLAALVAQVNLLTSALTIAKNAAAWLGRGGASENDLQKRAQTIQATINAMSDGSAGPMDDLAKARLQGLYKQLEDVNQQIATSMTAAYTMPEVTVSASPGGTGNPIGKKASADAASAAMKKLAEDQRKMTELVNDASKEYEAAQDLLIRYGDGASYAAREIEKLGDMMVYLEKNPAALARIQKDIADRAAEMDSNLRRAAGGFTGFAAGFDKAMKEMGEANDAFSQGKATVDMLSDAISDMVSGAEVDFGQLALSWVKMISEMEMKASMSALWSSFGGLSGLLGGGNSGGSGGGLISSIVGGLGGLLGFAEGGTPPVGTPYIVGENGPEIRIDRQPGAIFNREQIGNMGGGGTTVIVQQTVHFGSDVSRAEFNTRLRQVEESTMRGAKAAIIDDRRRAGPTKSIFR